MTNTNQLNSVTFNNGTAATWGYTYDQNGCLKTDTRRQITATGYGRANLPTTVQVSNKTVNYLYDANDSRVYKEVISTLLQQSPGSTSREYYLRTAAGQDLAVVDLVNQKLTWYIQGTQRVAHHEHQGTLPSALFSRMSGGICDAQVANLTAPTPAPAVAASFGPTVSPRPAMVFYNYDHLGNTRITYTCKVDYQIGTLTKKEYTAISLFDYDPYGKVLRSYGNERYLTTYHERDVETGLDYRGARFYDGETYRFLSLDPLQAKYPSVSSFSYVLGNPVMFVDPTGKESDPHDEMFQEAHNKWKEGLRSEQEGRSLNRSLANGMVPKLSHRTVSFSLNIQTYVPNGMLDRAWGAVKSAFGYGDKYAGWAKDRQVIQQLDVYLPVEKNDKGKYSFSEQDITTLPYPTSHAKINAEFKRYNSSLPDIDIFTLSVRVELSEQTTGTEAGEGVSAAFLNYGNTKTESTVVTPGHTYQYMMTMDRKTGMITTQMMENRTMFFETDYEVSGKLDTSNINIDKR